MGLNLVGSGNDGKLWHTIRDDDGSWHTLFGQVEGVVSGGPASFTAVACGSDDGQVLQVVGVGSDGNLWHTLRNADGSWQADFGQVEGVVSGGPARFAAVGCAGAAGVLQVVGVGSDGKLWHTLRNNNGSWQADFGGVEGVVSGGPASFTAVACGSDDGQVLQVVGVGSDGNLWHTLRNADGSWQTLFGGVEGVVSRGPATFVGIGAAGAADHEPEPTTAPSWADPAATNITENSVTLHWQSVPTAQSFFVDAVSIATGIAQNDASAGAGATSCTVSGLRPGTGYQFVLSYEMSGQWSPNATVEEYTRPAPPPPPVVVPALVGLTLTQALAALNRVGLQLGTLVNPSGQIENDLLKVVSQSPGPGTRLAIGSSVNLYVTPISQPVAGYSQVLVANGSGDGQPVEVWLINLATSATQEVGSVGFNDQKTFPLQNGVFFEIVAVDVTMSGCPGSDPTNVDCQRTIGFATGMTGGPTYPMQVD
jgi:hypothetical protein